MPITKMEIVFAYDATQPGKQGDPTALKAEDQNGEELNLQLDAPNKALPPGVLPIYTTGFTI